MTSVWLSSQLLSLSFFLPCFFFFVSFVCFSFSFFFFKKFSLSFYLFNLTVKHMGRGLSSVTTPEEAASMSAVCQLRGRPTPRSMSGASAHSLIRCNTWCGSSSVPQQERNDQDVHGTSEWPLLPPKLAWQWTEAVFVNKGPVNKVKLI